VRRRDAVVVEDLASQALREHPFRTASVNTMAELDDPASEVTMIRAFLENAMRDRFLALVSSRAGRPKFIRELDHFAGFKASSMVAIVAGKSGPDQVAATLRTYGAPDHCYAMSTNRALDKKWLGLDTALADVIGMGCGTILVCIPGRLGFFEGEGPMNRCVLTAG
jgi:hypothetical protein